MSNNAARTIEGMTALIVEDQPLIAMDLERILQEVGVTVLASLASTSDAIAFLESQSPHFAILDVDLGQETSEPVARFMLARKTPFFFATGYDDRSAIPADLAMVPIVHKPFEPEAILENLRAFTRPASAAPPS